jgi:prepilin-type processing-associated H-X9-DG protein
LIEILVVVAIIGLLVALLLPALVAVQGAARSTQCMSNLKQIGLAINSYYSTYNGAFFSHHPYDADVLANEVHSNSFAEIYWEDKLKPYIGGAAESDEARARQGDNSESESIYRCPEDRTVPKAFFDTDSQSINGIEHRTSYLLNSLLSHRTRRYGYWTQGRFMTEVGLSHFVDLSERAGEVFTTAQGNDPRQDDYDIWLGTTTIQNWISHKRHSGIAHYLFLDGHVETMSWSGAVRLMYPDNRVLEQDSSFEQ